MWVAIYNKFKYCMFFLKYFLVIICIKASLFYPFMDYVMLTPKWTISALCNWLWIMCFYISKFHMYTPCFCFHTHPVPLILPKSLRSGDVFLLRKVQGRLTYVTWFSEWVIPGARAFCRSSVALAVRHVRARSVSTCFSMPAHGRKICLHVQGLNRATQEKLNTANTFYLEYTL